jgi:hypothetical protein
MMHTHRLLRSPTRSRAVTFGLSLVAVAACCDSTDTPFDPPEPEAPIAYTLTSVPGGTLPVSLVADTLEFELQAGALVLNPDGTCLNSFTTTPSGGSQKTETFDCTYSTSGSALTYIQDGVTFTGRFFNGTAGIPRLEVADSSWVFMNPGTPIYWRNYLKN